MIAAVSGFKFPSLLKFCKFKGKFPPQKLWLDQLSKANLLTADDSVQGNLSGSLEDDPIQNAHFGGK